MEQVVLSEATKDETTSQEPVREKEEVTEEVNIWSSKNFQPLEDTSQSIESEFEDYFSELFL